jgi:hypothetical protein
MSLGDALKQGKTGGAPASSRAGLAVKPAREDAGAPFSVEVNLCGINMTICCAQLSCW